MYYDFTPEEKQRVEIAAFFGIKVDPVGYYDMAAVIIYSSILFIGLLANIYVLRNRHYAPLKAKNVPLMTGIFFHSIFFFLGDLTLCGLVHVRGPFFGNCTLMLIWFRSMMGNFSLGSLLTIRSYKLYRVFCLNKPTHGYKRALPYILYILLIITVGTISTMIPNSLTVAYMQAAEFCIDNPDLVTAYCSILWFVWAIYLAFMWLLRNVRSSFNEFREMAISLGLLVVCTIFNQTVLYYVPRLPVSLPWRLSLVSVDQITANYIWWLVMFKPLYNCIFHHDTYLTEWRMKLAADGLHAQYEMSTDSQHDASSHSNTLVHPYAGRHREQDDAKLLESDQSSIADSSQLAISRLAAAAVSADPLQHYHFGSSTVNPPIVGEKQGCLDNIAHSYWYRRSVNNGSERRKSEPFDRSNMSKYRMFTQRVAQHPHDTLDALDAVSVSSDSAIGVVLLPESSQQSQTHRGVFNPPLDDTSSAEEYIPSGRIPAKSTEIHRWHEEEDNSDTADTSLLSHRYGSNGGGRHII